jgi:hypothetical protein
MCRLGLEQIINVYSLEMEPETYNSHDNYVHVIEGDKICTEYG